MLYYINEKNGKRSKEEITQDIEKAEAIVSQEEGGSKPIRKQHEIIKKMHRPIWYRPRPDFLKQRF